MFASLFALASAGCGSEAPSASGVSFPADPIATVTSEGGGLRLAVRTSPSQPPPRGTCAVELTVTNVDGSPADGLSLDVVPWMPAHGHGASVRPSTAAKGNGTYLVTNVVFFMPGEWELRTTFTGSITDHAAPVVEVP